jgi:hypothetical protein
MVLAGDPDGLEAAATLAGALNGPVLGHLPTFLAGHHKHQYGRALAAVATALSPDAYARAQRDGAAMTHDEIVAFTLSELGRVADTGSRPAIEAVESGG